MAFQGRACLTPLSRCEGFAVEAGSRRIRAHTAWLLPRAVASQQVQRAVDESRDRSVGGFLRQADSYEAVMPRARWPARSEPGGRLAATGGAAVDGRLHILAYGRVARFDQMNRRARFGIPGSRRHLLEYEPANHRRRCARVARRLRQTRRRTRRTGCHRARPRTGACSRSLTFAPATGSRSRCSGSVAATRCSWPCSIASKDGTSRSRSNQASERSTCSTIPSRTAARPPQRDPTRGRQRTAYDPTRPHRRRPISEPRAGVEAEPARGCGCEANGRQARAFAMTRRTGFR